jgi:hypothetical protein
MGCQSVTRGRPPHRGKGPIAGGRWWPAKPESDRPRTGEEAGQQGISSHNLPAGILWTSMHFSLIIVQDEPLQARDPETSAAN